jgi:hypothetical protein
MCSCAEAQRFDAALATRPAGGVSARLPDVREALRPFREAMCARGIRCWRFRRRLGGVAELLDAISGCSGGISTAEDREPRRCPGRA